MPDPAPVPAPAPPPAPPPADARRGADFVRTLTALAWAVLIVSFLLLLIGENPFAVGLAVARGAFSTAQARADTVQYATPLLLAGLAVALAFRAGLFNIGVEGQLYVGAFAAAVVGVKLGPVFKWSDPPSLFAHILHAGIATFAGALAGALWGALAGWLKAWRGVHEVVATILLNFIALFLTDFLVNHPTFKEKGDIPQTEAVAATAAYPTFPESIPQTRLNWGFWLALALIAWAVYFLKRTRTGYEFQAVGHNPEAAACAGIPVKGCVVRAMALSGAVAGIVGVEQVLGVHGHFIAGFSPGYGFMGIAVALLARNNPLGLLATALLFATLKGGALRMDALTDVPREVVGVLQAVIILAVAAAMARRGTAEART